LDTPSNLSKLSSFESYTKHLNPAFAKPIAQLAPISPAPQIPTVYMIITSEKKTAST
jgi:hypothetical protein